MTEANRPNDLQLQIPHDRFDAVRAILGEPDTIGHRGPVNVRAVWTNIDGN